MSSTEHDVQALLKRYGEALSAGDIKTIVASWEVPALVVANKDARPVDTLSDVEQFFGCCRP